ncbi:hypothetical protein BY996DRAFT_7107531 [Phakopsora pachyrhizi]|nr:hypothetical protein BY996DRAFT_7107531 [Phakopsora pachyrhizi]
MGSKYPNIVFFMVLWTEYLLGSEEGVDFLEKFSAQTSTYCGMRDVLEPNVQPEVLEKNWLSLGTSSSNEHSNSKGFKKATDSIDFPMGVLGKTNDFGANKFLRKPVYCHPHPNEYARPTAAEMVASHHSGKMSESDGIHWNHNYRPKHLLNQRVHYQPLVNTFEPSKTMDANEEKAQVSEIAIQLQTKKHLEEASISDTSKKVLKRKKDSDGQTVKNKISGKNLSKNKNKYPKKIKGLLEADLQSIVRAERFIISALQRKIQFKQRLMKLLEPKNSLINLEFIQECISSLRKSLEFDVKLSMLANLNIIEKQILKNGDDQFYIKDLKVKDFFTKPYDISFKIKYNPPIKPNYQEILNRFQTDFRRMIESIDFRNLVRQFIPIDEQKGSHTFKPEEWQAFDGNTDSYLRKSSKKMYVGKVFLVYSIIINKIFCDGPKDDGFFRRQRGAIEFYNSVCGALEPDEKGIFFINRDSIPVFADTSTENPNLIKLISSFNKSLANKRYVHLDRNLFIMAMNLIRIWLIQYRPQLHNKITSKRIFHSLFKPFLNSILEILLKLSG